VRRTLALACAVCWALALLSLRCVSLEGFTGGGDAASDGDAARERACATGTQRYCDDFDDRSTVSGGVVDWRQAAPPGATVALDPEGWSPPSAALVQIPANARLNAGMGQRLPLPSATLRLELELKLDVDTSAFGAASSDSVTITSITASSGDVAAVSVGRNGLVISSVHGLTDGGAATLGFPLQPFPLGRWTHVVLSVTFDATAGAAYLAADGIVLVDKKNIPTLRAGALGVPAVDLALGTGATGMTPAVEVRFDDVKIF
jgi:hypothetical protein